MNAARVFGLAAVVAGALALPVWLVGHAGPCVTSTTAGLGPMRLEVPAGASLVYHVTYEDESVTSVAAGREAEGRMDLDADLVLSSFGGTGGVTLFSARLSHVRRGELSMLGKDVLTGEGAAIAFAVHEALVEIGDDGRVRAMYYPGEPPALFQHVMQRLLGSIDLTLPSDSASAFDAVERGPNGRARVRYTRTNETTLSRTRLAYADLPTDAACPGCLPTLSARGTVTFDPAGHVREIHDEESLSVARPDGAIALTSRTRFDLSLTRVEEVPVHPVAVSELERREPGAIVDQERIDARALEGMVGNMTLAKMTYGIAIYAHLAKMPKEHGWMVRAASLVVLHPETCDALLDNFRSPGYHLRAKALALEILASAGTTTAQAAMRTGLELARAELDDEAYLQLLQIFSFVRRPDVESASFVAKHYGQAQGRLRYAAAYALGAMGSGLAAAGDLASARQISLKLAVDLERATSAEERAHLVTALGAVGSDENVGRLAELARDADAGVREAAARSLHKPANDSARAVLLRLLADPEERVQKAAMGALTRHALRAEDLRAIHERIARNELSPEVDGRLTVMLSTYLEQSEEVRPILEQLLARSTDRALRAQLRDMIARARHV